MPTSSQYGRACAHWRSNLFPLLDKHATDYDAVLTTARLTTMHGTHDARVQGLSQAWRRVTDQGLLLPRATTPTTRIRRATQPLLFVAVPRRSDRRLRVVEVDNLYCWFYALTLAQGATPGSTLVDLTDYLCRRETCPVVIGGVDVYADSNHLTVTYARTLAPYLDRVLVGEGLLTRPQKSGHARPLL